MVLMIEPSSNVIISVVVVNYNAGLMLANCVASALEQAQEIIVVDNASSDNSLEMLESKFPDDSRLKVIHNSENLGFSAACNVGTKTARGDYLLYLNPDCLLQNGTVIKLLEGFDAGDRVGMVGGRLTNPDGTEQAGGRRAIPTPWRSFVRAFGLSSFSHRWPRLFYDFHLHKEPLPDYPVSVEAISGACMMISRVAIEDVGYWDEGYFLHCEDLDLCMRFRQRGWEILFVPGASIVHYLGACSSSCPIFVEKFKHKGMMRFYRKFFRHQYPGVLMWLVAMGIWLRFSGLMACIISRRFSQWVRVVCAR